MSSLLHLDKRITLVPVANLRHIESYSKRRVKWLIQKIKTEQIWTTPLCVDKHHYLVMDGQHRMETAKLLGLRYVPCVLFDYAEVDIWSLRDNYTFDVATVVERSLCNNIYPYKTVKHRFPFEIPEIAISLSELMQFGNHIVVNEVETSCA
jgi:hypothetical protein